MESNWNSYWESKLVQLLWKTVWQFLIKLNVYLPYDLVTPFFVVYLMSND